MSYQEALRHADMGVLSPETAEQLRQQGSKECTSCGDTKSLVEFWRDRSEPDDRSMYCIPCARAAFERSARKRVKA